MKEIDRAESSKSYLSSSSTGSIDQFLVEENIKKTLINNKIKAYKDQQMNLTKIFADQEIIVEKVPVDVKIEFLKFGQIETKNEKFDAELLLECSWEDKSILYELLEKYDNINKESMIATETNENSTQLLIQYNPSNLIVNLNELLKQIKYDPKVHWNPQIYIENTVGELKEEFLYKMELVILNESKNQKSNDSVKFQLPSILSIIDNIMVRIIEKRKVKGVFYERLELYDFPFDVQELSINLASKSPKNDACFKDTMSQRSIVNLKGFRDQQQWKLFNFVNTNTIESYDTNNLIKKPVLRTTAYIARYPNYYIYNVLIIIFLITSMGFIPFSFDPAIPHFRAIVTAILINIFITLRWAFNQVIPSISYLTILDKYAIFSFLFLITLMVWHALIGSDLFSSTSDEKKKIEIKFLYAISACYFVVQCVFLIILLKLFLFRRFTKRKLQSINKQKDNIVKRKKLVKLLKADIVQV